MWRSRWAAVACVLVYLVVGAAYREVVPAWEAPDEPWHAVYAEQLAAGHLPTPAETYEWHQPPAYYALLAAGLRWLGLPQLPRWQSNPRHPFAEAALVHPPQDPAESPLRLLRAWSGLIGALVVALTWATARRAWPTVPDIAPAAALLVALWPQFLFIGHSLSNDSLAAVAGALTTYGLVRVVTRLDRPWPGAVAVGLGLTIGVFAKLNALAVAPAAAVALAAVWRTGRDHRAVVLRALGLALAVPVIVVIGTLAVWPALLDGVAVTLRERAMGTAAGLDAVALLRLSAEMAMTFIGRFGWLNVPLPKAVTVAIGLGIGVGVLGLWRLRGQPAQLRWAVAVLATAGATVAVAAVRNLLADPQPQGRFLFPALAAIAVVLAVGWRLIVGERRWNGAVAVAGLGLLGVNHWILVRTLPAAYASSHQSPPAVLWRSMGSSPDVHRRLAVTSDPGLKQTFPAHGDIAFEVAVPVAKVSGAVVATMKVRDAKGRLLGRQVVSAPRPGQWLSVVAQPAGAPVVQPLAFEVDTAGKGTMELWAATSDVAPDGQLTVNGQPQPFDLVLLVTAAPNPDGSARPPPVLRAP